MEKRIIHHFQMSKIMLFMHLLIKNVSLRTLFETADDVFLIAFVGAHKELVTELLNLKIHFNRIGEVKDGIYSLVGQVEDVTSCP